MSTQPWCPMSGRVLSGHDWTGHKRVWCPECGWRLTVVAGRVPKHRIRAKRGDLHPPDQEVR